MVDVELIGVPFDGYGRPGNQASAARVVTSNGVNAPVVTDGPFVEFKEMLAGFQVVDVESEERAIEIAARVSQVPGPGGVPLEQPITVRRVMGDADFEELNPLG